MACDWNFLGVDAGGVGRQHTATGAERAQRKQLARFVTLDPPSPCMACWRANAATQATQPVRCLVTMELAKCESGHHRHVLSSPAHT